MVGSVGGVAAGAGVMQVSDDSKLGHNRGHGWMDDISGREKERGHPWPRGGYYFFNPYSRIASPCRLAFLRCLSAIFLWPMASKYLTIRAAVRAASICSSSVILLSSSTWQARQVGRATFYPTTGRPWPVSPAGIVIPRYPPGLPGASPA